MKKQNSEKNRLNIKKYFLFALPAVLFFSYFPLFIMGSNSLMNLELSLPIIWLFLFSIASIPSVIIFLKTTIKTKKTPLIISTLFPLYSSITLLWAENFLRAFLTTGMIWCLWLSTISIIEFFKTEKPNKKFKNNLKKVLFVSTTAVCIFCWVQCFLDTFGIARETTLLCAGCTNASFGFPHPSGFAIEPQFMGNLLLFPVFVIIYSYLNSEKKHEKRKLLVLLLFFTSTLFLTMSRGAIYAFFVGLAVLLFLKIKADKNPKPICLIPLIMLSFLFTLTFQGFFAEFSPTNDTFQSGISKVINQMSLGIINLPYELTEDVTENEPIFSQFDGYAEVSTTARLDLSKLAFKTWISSPTNLIFGVGTGSAGKAMHSISPETIGEKEIVQNGLFEILVEFGLIGVIILILNLLLLLRIIRKTENAPLTISIIVAFLISYLFFSGLPNALHIFLLPATLISGSKKQSS